MVGPSVPCSDALDLERLLQRYQNVKSELESQQNIERIRAEKFMNYHLSSQVFLGGEGCASARACECV